MYVDDDTEAEQAGGQSGDFQDLHCAIDEYLQSEGVLPEPSANHQEDTSGNKRRRILKKTGGR